MDIETVIQGRALVNGELKYTEIGVNEGKIVAVGSYVSGGERRIELGTSMTLLPGFTDPHVHFRDPGLTQKEDFTTGSMAALHAGVTTVLDMPNTKPAVFNLDTLLAKKSAVKGRSYTDYGLFAAITPETNSAMIARYVPGFKLFMGSTTGNILLNDDDEMIPAVKDALSTGKRVSVHAEDDSMILREPEKCTRDHLRNRPAKAEINAITRLANSFRGEKINICHVTTPAGLDLARAAGFTTEVTMHHMMFEVDGCTSSYYKTNPPIREKATRDELFKRFVDGDFTMVGTDHAPHTVAEKEQDFDSAPGGMPGVETTIPMLMAMVRKEIIPLKQVVRMGAEAPGEAFGLKKGKIEVGYDADFAVFDMRNVSKVDPKKLHSKCGHTQYGGKDAIFPDTVIIRGEVQVEGAEFCGERMGEDICG